MDGRFIQDGYGPFIQDVAMYRKAIIIFRSYITVLKGVVLWDSMTNNGN